MKAYIEVERQRKVYLRGRQQKENVGILLRYIDRKRKV